KDALDDIYRLGSSGSDHILNSLEVYGGQKFAEEFKFCVDEILRVCTEGAPEKLRDIVFRQKTTNAFPAVFALLMVAFHELIIGQKKKIADYACVRDGLNDLVERIQTTRRSTSPEERRKNVETIK